MTDFSRAMLQQTHLSSLLYLYRFTLKNGRIFGLYPDKSADQTITFQGQSYRSHPLEADGFSWEPHHDYRPFMRLARQNLPVTVSPSDDVWRGGNVQRLITFASECAPPVGDDGGSAFPIESWVIDRIDTLDDHIMHLALLPHAQLQGKMLPKRIIVRDLCQHRYRHYDEASQSFDYKGATCPYVGQHYFDETGRKVTDPAQDRCSYRLEGGCKKRFAGALPFFGFPGLARS